MSFTNVFQYVVVIFTRSWEAYSMAKILDCLINFLLPNDNYDTFKKNSNHFMSYHLTALKLRICLLAQSCDAI
jgi:hypothetical protein